MWEIIGDERYVANPAKGSGHNRGLAVDVTLISTKTGEEINMGTGFDNFTDTAHHTFKDLPVDVLKNRKLLKTTMERWGFRALETEWWHYSFPNDRNYEVLNLSFKELKKYR
jgi:D-alanyl-D-alanine dipeptidase